MTAYSRNAQHSRASADSPDAESLQDLLLSVLKQANRPLNMDRLLRIAAMPRKKKKQIETALRSLEEQGRCLRAPGGWSILAHLKHMQGILSVQQTGGGFVTPFRDGPVIYIHPAAMADAWPGDRVEVAILPGKRGPHFEGKIISVLRRALTELPVRVLRQRTDSLWLCAPLNPRIPALFLVDVACLYRKAKENDILFVNPEDKNSPHLWTASATVNLEHAEKPAIQERLIKSLHDIPGPFAPEVLAEVRNLPVELVAEDFIGRRDLRYLDFVTIDARSARDFDDAVHVEKKGDGFRLRVAIADVAHYVRQDTALDIEARLRGNSCYFPLSVEPMLPERLSNDLCSLRPLMPRLAMVVDMCFSQNGHVQETSLYPAVIRSLARLTYGQIRRALLLHEPDEEQRLAVLLPMLREAENLAGMLMTLRRERGCLDFDLPETEIRFNEAGEITHMARRQRHFGHRLIEEFMIAANETVASFLAKQGQVVLYRVHHAPDPDKLRSLIEFLNRSGLKCPIHPPKPTHGRKTHPISPMQLSHLLLRAKDNDQEYTVARLLLRSMMQARYQPGNEGHFGLASSCYCHFTSPIRRYADLLVHRAVKKALGMILPDGESSMSSRAIEHIGNHINETERKAMAAERELHKRLAILFLRDKTGESFEGIISGITNFGVFVELFPYMAEGMIRLENLGEDSYEHRQECQELRGKRTRQTFRLGQRLRVFLTDVSLSRLEINLSLGEDGHMANGDTKRLPSGITRTGRTAAKKVTPRNAPRSRRKKYRSMTTNDFINSRPLKNRFTLLKEQGLLPGVRLPEVK
ncbi:MAG: ribonuclease R [Desulfovibrio sp.]|jgi:ribonuclease R|nr:ribonuclease R [Desulfovibrio sp.]